MNEITPALAYDLRADMDDLAGDFRRAAAGDPPLDDFDDHLKSAIRSLFGQMEAFVHSLTVAVLKSDTGTLQIGNYELAVLSERDHDPVTDVISTETRHYPLALRLEVASRHFLGICGLTTIADWDPDVKRYLKDLTRTRNHLTHPTRIEHLIVAPAFESFRQIAIWFPAYASHVLSVASLTLGLPARKALPISPVPPLPAAIPRAEQIFDDHFYRRIFSDPGSAIRYISFFSNRLDEEIKRAFDHSRDALSPPYDPDRVGRAVRRMVRAITTNLEGLIGFTSFFMRAVRRSKVKVVCPQPIKDESPPDRAVRVLTAFSSAFGADVLPKRDASWRALRTVFDIRDRLTHPRAAGHVLLKLDHLDATMNALGWFLNQAFPAILLDQEKIADCFGSRKPAR